MILLLRKLRRFWPKIFLFAPPPIRSYLRGYLAHNGEPAALGEKLLPISNFQSDHGADAEHTRHVWCYLVRGNCTATLIDSGTFVHPAGGSTESFNGVAAV